MRGLMVVGVVLVIIGVVGLIVDVVPIHHQEEVAKIGSLTATADKETDVIIPTYAAVIAVLAGGVLIFIGRRPS